MKISIITPSYNQGNFIEETIQSVLSQNLMQGELEYVVMDGGSKDQTTQLLKRYASQLKWVSEPDNGQAHAVNKGIQTTTGDVIGWLNSDDLYYPDTLAHVLQFFLANPHINVLYGDAAFINERGELIGFYPTEKWRLARLFSTCYLSQPAVFFRRSVVKQYGLLDEKLNYCLDYAYWLNLGVNGASFAYKPTLFAATRLHSATKTASFAMAASNEAINVVKNQLGYVPTQWLVHRATAQAKTKLNYPCSRLKLLFATWVELWAVSATNGNSDQQQKNWLRCQCCFVYAVLKRGVNAFIKKYRYRKIRFKQGCDGR